MAGSALAAAVAAYLAGRLGVYGTVIGAGVVSVVATTGGSIFQHLFRRTGEQVKEVTVSTRPRPRRRQQVLGGRAAASGTRARATSGDSPAGATMVLPTFGRDGTEDEVTSVAAAMDRAAEREPAGGTAVAPGLPGASGAADATRALPMLSEVATRALCPTSVEGADDETRMLPRPDHETQLLRSVGPETRPLHDAGQETQLLHGADQETQLFNGADRETQLLRSADSATRSPKGADEKTQLLKGAGPEAQLNDADRETQLLQAPPDAAEEEHEPALYGTRWRGRRRTWLAGLAVFLLAMAGVTVFELATGHDAAGGTGTSVTNLFHSRGSGGAPATPTPSPGAATEDTDRGGATDGPTPQPDATGGTADTGSGSGSGTETGSDGATQKGTGSGTDDSSATPGPTPSDDGGSAEPTPTPSPSDGTGGASDSPDSADQETEQPSDSGN
ncbi:hypothetical protein C3486_10905 [Streptomyces sp. Ru73]|nr:hypothetical protein C3486_10905 [Streptomyces sp. Ru73]